MHQVPLFEDFVNSYVQNGSVLTQSYSPSLKTFLLHGHSWRSFLPDITQETHLHAAVGRSQGGRVAALEVNAAAIVTWFT
jgi:hypothetical protein